MAWQEHDEILAVRVDRDDVVVYRPAKELSPARAKSMQARLRRAFPRNKILMMHAGDELWQVTAPSGKSVLATQKAPIPE